MVAVVRRVAIGGLGRIGRHHAKWYRHFGCEVVGFTVRRPESLAAARDDLPGVPGFLDWTELLEATRPDAVSVCTPAEAHAPLVREALMRGLPVLCEKPLCWAAEPSAALAEAGALVDLAERRGALLAVNLQYTYAAAPYFGLLPAEGPPSTCEVVLESKGKGALREPDEIWMELGPHALSLAFGLLPGATPALDTLAVTTAPQRVAVTFAMHGPAGTSAVRIACGQRPEGALERRFGLNGRLVELSGRNNAQGVYCTYLRTPTEEVEYPDLMATSVRRFVDEAEGRGGLATGGAQTMSNLVVQVEVAAALTGGREGRSSG